MPIDLTTLGRWLMLVGAIIFGAGLSLWVMGRLGWSFGQLPGDIRIERDGVTFYFPLATSIIVSVILTLLINLLLRFLKK